MVISCAAVNCTNRQGKVDKSIISFHRFPIKNARRLELWKQAVRRERWTPNKYSFLCSKHFTPDSFQERYEDQHRQLKGNAVPSIFDFTDKTRNSNSMVRRKVLCKDSLEQDAVSEEQGVARVAKKRKAASQEDVTKKERDISPIAVEEGPQHAVGEWAMGGSGEAEVFTPSSCSFIGTLHSYSYTSRQERDQTARSKHKKMRKKAESESKNAAAPTASEHDLIKNVTILVPDPHPVVGPVKHSSGSSCRHVLIDSLHSYCFTDWLASKGQGRHGRLVRRQLLRRRARRLQVQLQLRKGKELMERKRTQWVSNMLAPHRADAPLNPVIKPLEWMLGTWECDEPGEGTFPTIQPFRYTETLHIFHVGQPMLNFMFNAFHSETKKPLHRECGFIRVEPGKDNVAFIIAQNTGLVEIEEGKLSGQELTLQSQSVSRISFAKEPHVQQISRTFRLKEDGRLEQTVCMATEGQPLSKHLHITYRKRAP
ncbi:THAP domain-containing protein 4 isoform X1 [Acipenser ruthenus]|uniref:THAP domain-containing protein 4 isoform X1 n=1 Tax=Acipenser ruthenus TaxID=7906 RepID=UPI002740893C|nr:THAP domain-containing protein 4 isoform X1 [Acipenser ruthenus]